MLGYLLSKKEGRVGGPERPLSGLGEVTYKRYWSLSVMRYLRNAPDRPSIEGESFVVPISGIAYREISPKRRV